MRSATILRRHTLLAAPLISSASVVQIQRVYSNYALYLMCNFIVIMMHGLLRVTVVVQCVCVCVCVCVGCGLLRERE